MLLQGQSMLQHVILGHLQFLYRGFLLGFLLNRLDSLLFLALL